MSLRSKRFARCLLLAFLTVCSAGSALAQTQASTGQIAGVIKDSSGAVIPNATIEVTNTSTGLKQSAVSGAEGLFRAILLPAGNYAVLAKAGGFADATANNVVVQVGRTSELNITMSVGQVEQHVDVSDQAIQVTQSQPDALVNRTAIENLPILGRRFQDFVTLTPTAQVEPSRQQISLSGQRGVNGNINIDGQDYNNPFFGGIRGGERSNSAFTIPQESIQEFQVIDSGYSAEFGRSTGGLITAITRSGTNDYHGSLFYLNRNRGLAHSNEYLDTVGQQAGGLRISPAPTQQQFGGSAGGPIVREKLFFFGAYEHQLFGSSRQVLFSALQGFTPTAPVQQEGFNYYRSLQTPYKQTNNAKTFFGRADYQINKNNRFNGRYNYSDNHALNSTTAGTQISPVTNAALSNNGTEQDKTNTVVGQLASFFSSNLANEVRFEYSKEDRPRLANAQAPTVQAGLIGNFGTVSFLPTTESDYRVQGSDNITLTRGTHTFKLGGEYNYAHSGQTFGFSQFGFFNVGTPRASASNPGGVAGVLQLFGTDATHNRFDNPNVSYSRQIGNLIADYSVSNVAFFGQDSWKIRSNFTLNYGLRWEGVFNPQPESSNTALVSLVKGFTFPNGRSTDPTAQIPNQLHEFGPRLGFAWDPFNDQKTVIRAFTGIYYAQTPALLYSTPMTNYRMPAGDLRAFLPFRVSGTGTCSAANPTACKTIYQQFKLIGIDLNITPVSALPVLTVAQVQQIASLLGQNPSVSGLAPLSVDNNFHDPRSYQYGFGIEHELSSGWSIGLDLTQIKTVYLERNRDLNLPRPLATTDAAGRQITGLSTSGGTQARPIATLASVQVRESTAKSLYRSLVLRTNYSKKWGQLNFYYTLSQNLSDDDNERDAGGVTYDNPFNLAPEYNFSNLDRKHQFTAFPVFHLPLGFDVSTAMRLRSGAPVDASAGVDANQDGLFNDRPYSAVGVPFKRNAFRNYAIYNWDIRVAKTFKVWERVQASLSADIFNVPNLMNLTLSGPTVLNYCSSALRTTTCGLQGPPSNLNFLQLRDQTPGSSTFGRILTTNKVGDPLQLQLGARITF